MIIAKLLILTVNGDIHKAYTYHSDHATWPSCSLITVPVCRNGVHACSPVMPHPQPILRFKFTIRPGILLGESEMDKIRKEEKKTAKYKERAFYKEKHGSNNNQYDSAKQKLVHDDWWKVWV